MLKILAKRNVA